VSFIFIPRSFFFLQSFKIIQEGKGKFQFSDLEFSELPLVISLSF